MGEKQTVPAKKGRSSSKLPPFFSSGFSFSFFFFFFFLLFFFSVSFLTQSTVFHQLNCIFCTSSSLTHLLFQASNRHSFLPLVPLLHTFSFNPLTAISFSCSLPLVPPSRRFYLAFVLPSVLLKNSPFRVTVCPPAF